MITSDINMWLSGHTICFKNIIKKSYIPLFMDSPLDEFDGIKYEAVSRKYYIPDDKITKEYIENLIKDELSKMRVLMDIIYHPPRTMSEVDGNFNSTGELIISKPYIVIRGVWKK